MNALGTFAPQGKFIFGQGKRWLADLTDDHLALEPIAGTKTAGWLVGHLSVTGDFGRRICGLTPMCPKEWRAIFNPGTFMKNASGFWLWKGPPWTPPPQGPRTTMGTPPPQRKRLLAA